MGQALQLQHPLEANRRLQFLTRSRYARIDAGALPQVPGAALRQLEVRLRFVCSRSRDRKALDPVGTGTFKRGFELDQESGGSQIAAAESDVQTPLPRDSLEVGVAEKNWPSEDVRPRPTQFDRCPAGVIRYQATQHGRPPGVYF